MVIKKKMVTLGCSNFYILRSEEKEEPTMVGDKEKRGI